MCRVPFPILVLVAILVFSPLGGAVPRENRDGSQAENALVKVEKTTDVPPAYRSGFDSITGLDAHTLLAFLAADNLEGRETGSRGYRLAADFAASLFALWGVHPAGDGDEASGRGYLQEVVMKEYSGLGCTLHWQTGGDERVFHEGIDMENYYRNRIPETVAAPVVFAGYGIREKSIAYDDFTGIDVRNKIVMILDGLPGAGDPVSPFDRAELRDQYKGYTSFFGRLKKTAEIAKMGPKAVLVIGNLPKNGAVYTEIGSVNPPDERPIIHEPSRLITLPGARREEGAIYITRATADAILAAAGHTIGELQDRIATTRRPASFALPNGVLTIQTTAATEKLVRCHNVIGFVPGADPTLRNETVIVGAHLDHLGRRGEYVFNGADDNASGAAAVLQISRAVAGLAQKPRRTIVFCLWTAEEFNLLGSTHYCREPAFPLDRTVAYLNLDMIGRNDDTRSLKQRLKRLNVPVEVQQRISPDRFMVVSCTTGRGLGEILQRANQAVGVDLWTNAEKTVKRAGIVSDYLPFADAGVPYLYWEGAVHEDYHQTSDSIYRINTDWLAGTARLAYLTAMALADK